MRFAGNAADAKTHARSLGAGMSGLPPRLVYSACRLTNRRLRSDETLQLDYSNAGQASSPGFGQSQSESACRIVAPTGLVTRLFLIPHQEHGRFFRFFVQNEGAARALNLDVKRQTDLAKHTLERGIRMRVAIIRSLSKGALAIENARVSPSGRFQADSTR